MPQTERHCVDGITVMVKMLVVGGEVSAVELCFQIQGLSAGCGAAWVLLLS